MLKNKISILVVDDEIDICEMVAETLRDENYNPYLENPHIWTIETSPTPIMWLYFNHYGKNLMVIQSSDQAYYDYLSGDPLGDNQYLLPDSNIQNGYGLFTSTYSKAFFINVDRKD